MISAGSRFKRFQCFAFVDISVKKPCSHKYVDEKGRWHEMAVTKLLRLFSSSNPRVAD
jgi:hypothetical protein